MYREEVDQLVTMFKRCAKITISDSKYRYDSLEEMKQNVGPKIKDLDIRGENPGVRFLFNQTEEIKNSSPPTQTVFNELRTEEITEAANALFYEIKEFLLTHQRPRFRKSFLVGGIVSAIGMVWFALQNHTINEQGQVVVSSPWFGIFIVAFIACGVASVGMNNSLSLETKRNSASFFVRNREDFAKHAVTAAITGVIGYCIGRFLK